MKIKIGSRKSNLALYQTRRVATALKDIDSEIETEIVTKETLGDEIKDKALPDIGSKGLFTAKLEKALYSGEIDCAVHSLKDLPSSLADGLEFAGTLQRGNPSDAFVSPQWESLDELPDNPTIATGSRRRRGQLNEHLDSVEVVGVRGNIETRLRKLDKNRWDGLMMAATALQRLELGHRIAQQLDPTTFIPAASQGAIGIEICNDHPQIEDLIAKICHSETMNAVLAERAFLRKLEGGCSVPIGVFAKRIEQNWHVHGWVGSLDGSDILRDTKKGPDPIEKAKQLATQFIEEGAEQIISDAIDDDDR